MRVCVGAIKSNIWAQLQLTIEAPLMMNMTTTIATVTQMMVTIQVKSPMLMKKDGFIQNDSKNIVV